uniref:Uncharacterized protein n=1 Tax=Anopheles farauti TaxID=69004 RepID=A0A182Q6T7_9DIPT
MSQMQHYWCIVFVIPTLVILSYIHAKPALFDLPELTVFSNETKDFSLRVLRYVCIEAPYERSVLNYCRTHLRRNQPTLFNLSIQVDDVLNELYIHMKTYYKYKSFQTFPIDVVVEVCSFLRNPTKDVISRHVLSVLIELMPQYAHHCPHGNTTYNVLFWLEERFLPKSMPAGDYRLDAWFRDKDNVTFFAYQAFCTIHMDKIRNMTDVLHMDRTTYVLPSPEGFKVRGKDFEIHFDRISVTNGDEGEGVAPQPQEDFTPTLVKRKTYVWEITRHQPTVNMTVPVFAGGKHDKLGTPPFQNALPPSRDSDAKLE